MEETCADANEMWNFVKKNAREITGTLENGVGFKENKAH